MSARHDSYEARLARVVNAIPAAAAMDVEVAIPASVVRAVLLGIAHGTGSREAESAVYRLVAAEIERVATSEVAA